ncbi:hypothetical protein [Nocardia rhizosphaerae]|uniref:Flagellar protein FliS n=1 Tax=Nocardia rhizosphaerae TaxID=1691571 RepID=A0ABV8LAS3_9NOCA
MDKAGVAVRPVEFAGFDRGCAEFLRVIEEIVVLAGQIAGHEHWGLGERDARLISGRAVVARLRAKADGGSNSIGAVMAAHARFVTDLRRAYRQASNQLIRADEEWARHLNAAAVQDVPVADRHVRV